MRVALLTNILSPYRMPAFRALAHTPEWTLRVFVNAEGEFTDYGYDQRERLGPVSLPVQDRPGINLPKREGKLASN